MTKIYYFIHVTANAVADWAAERQWKIDQKRIAAWKSVPGDRKGE